MQRVSSFVLAFCKESISASSDVRFSCHKVCISRVMYLRILKQVIK
ncbi:hypothetical protein [uncultured Methanobrevibacter sp.]|nr:hypothetical protein [uncultured Methanobrevibacter sp.]